MDYRRYEKRPFLNFGNIFFMILVVGLVILFFLIRANRHFEIKQISPAPERLRLAWEPEELEEVSDLVVTGQITAPGRTYRDDAVRYMETRLIVNEVLRGNAVAGDVIVLTEECYTDNFGMTLWTQEGYLPAEVGDCYLFFLKKYDDDSRYASMCYPVDLEYGKYRIPEDTETFSADLQNAVTAEDRDFFQLGPDGDLDKYARWYAYVMSRFLGLE